MHKTLIKVKKAPKLIIFFKNHFKNYILIRNKLLNNNGGLITVSSKAIGLLFNQ